MARCRTEIVTLRAEIKAKVAHIRLFQIDEEKLLSERDQLRQALEKHAQQWELVENAIPNEFEGSEETIGSIVATIVAQRDEAVQYRTGHLPHCDGFDYEQMRCACGYLDGTAYRELVGQVNVLHRQRNDAIEKARSDRAALAGLLPFVLESYYPNCATPEFKAAVEAAQEALLLEIRKQP